MEFPIANGFYRSESRPLSDQEAVNCYPVIPTAPALSQECLFYIPGIKLRATMPGEEGQAARGLHVMDGVPYVVVGQKLWAIAPDFSVSLCGTILGNGSLSITDNGDQLLILEPGGHAYIYEKNATTLTEITDSDFRANGNPQIAIFIDGYFCCTTDSKQFIVSDLNNGLVWNALDVGSAESDPDIAVAPAKVGNRLFIFGGETAEEFQNIGGASFPFQRTGFILPKGLFAKFALVEAQGSLVWIGGGKNESAAIWALSGNSYEKVSTGPIDELLKSLTIDELQSIYAWYYSDKGAFFCGFALPKTTIVYDLSTKRWHERKSYVSGQLTAYRVSGFAKAYNKTICADTIDGRIGEILDSELQEYGQTIIRRFTCQPFYNQGKSIFIPSIELLMETGVGNSLCEEPVIEMEVSKNGKTWSQPRRRSVGKVGDYKRRVMWTRNGRFSNFGLLRFTFSDPAKFVVFKLIADVIGGIK